MDNLKVVTSKKNCFQRDGKLYSWVHGILCLVSLSCGVLCCRQPWKLQSHGFPVRAETHFGFKISYVGFLCGPQSDRFSVDVMIPAGIWFFARKCFMMILTGTLIDFYRCKIRKSAGFWFFVRKAVWWFSPKVVNGKTKQPVGFDSAIITSEYNIGFIRINTIELYHIWDFIFINGI